MFMAKTMRVLDITTLTLPDGTAVDWRADLFNAIKALAKPVKIGDKPAVMFMNDARRWGETYPTLATAYMIGSLKDIDAALQK
jgi:hypothetical protein